MSQSEEPQPGPMKRESSALYQVVPFLFRSAQGGKHFSSLGLNRSSKLLFTPGQYLFGGNGFQGLLDDLLGGSGHHRTKAFPENKLPQNPPRIAVKLSQRPTFWDDYFSGNA
jgi:hypothetical protein